MHLILTESGARTVSGSPVIAATDITYTGQRNLPDTGLMDYRARFYSSALGRFIQPDTIIPNTADPQSWNRYSYVQNRPINFNDPTGHLMDDGGSSGGGGGGPTPPIPPLGGGASGSAGSCDIECELNNDLVDIVDPLYDILGGSNSSSGCNTLLLWNGSEWCHHTTYDSKPICLKRFDCSPEKQWAYALRFQYPGQLPWMPVYNGANRHVVGGDFTPWQWWRDKGAITVSIDGQMIINTTDETHIFHEGDIYRTISEGTVTTEGYGTNTSIVTAAMNQYIGPDAFKANDFVMLTFTTLDQISNERLMPAMDAVARHFIR